MTPLDALCTSCAALRCVAFRCVALNSVALLPDRGQKGINVGVVPDLGVVVRKHRFRPPKDKGSSLSQRVPGVLRSQILESDIVHGGLVGSSEVLQCLLIVPGHHLVHGRRIPHGSEALGQAQRLTGSPGLITKTQGRIDAELGGKLQRGVGRSDPDEKELAIVVRVCRREHLVAELRRVFPAQKSAVVAQKGANCSLVCETKEGVLLPQRGKGNGGTVRGAGERRAAQILQQAGRGACG